MKHIYMNEIPGSPAKRTRLWEVRSRVGGHCLGTVMWHSPWRRYCFWPVGRTILEQDCLRDIAQFIEDQTREHKKACRAAKGA